MRLPALWVTGPLTAAAHPRGVTATCYRIDGGARRNGSVVLLVRKAPHTRAGLDAGVHTVEYYSTGGAGTKGSAGACQVILRKVALD